MTDFAFLLGLAVAVVGVAMIFVPAAVILAGAGISVAAWRLGN